MAHVDQKSSLAMETLEIGGSNDMLDDDGHPKRTGTVITASAHIVTAVIGSGVLSLSWAIAQLGWIAGTGSLFIFSLVTLFTANLLADSYRTPNPITGKRNPTYIMAVKSSLGEFNYKICGIAQYSNLVGVTIGYAITSSISLAAIKRSNCFHEKGHRAGCHTSTSMYMIIFGIIEIILSQLPNFHKISWLSVVAAVMSFAYSIIGLSLSIAKAIGNGHVRTSLTGTTVGVDVTGMEKIWNCLQAIGNIAFAYGFAIVLVEIQDTLKSSPPESKVMKRAALIGISVSTIFYISCGTLGYAAFGNNAPGNFLTGFGFYEPFWLVDIANICIVVHLVGAYQVFAQPIFTLVENWSSNQWPKNEFLTRDYPINIPCYGVYPFNLFRLVWRTLYVIITTVIAMIFPFFNNVLGLLGAATFWPLSVYFPIAMYFSRAKIRRFSLTWIGLNILVWACLIISLLAAGGSIQGIVADLHSYKPFTSVT